MMPLFSENWRTCQSVPITAPVTIPLIPAYENVKQISAYRLGYTPVYHKNQYLLVPVMLNKKDTSEERSVHLGTGTEFILTMQSTTE
jgi:hypothetical protein